MNKIKLLKRLFVLTAMILWGGATLYAQSQMSVTGTITDGKAPLVGVTIMVKGTQIGAATDAKGEYKINVPNSKSILVYSYIGYKQQEIAVGAQKLINVIMNEDSNLLDELVVVGYGVQQKSHLTGSIAKVDGSSLLDMPVSDVTQALQGKVTGLSIQNTTSEVGVAPEIRVRGVGSISANSSPLVVVDGHPVPDGLSMVNSADIKSIEILKDAASAAIYGSRAANGVIMITTKSGEANKAKYAVKFYSGLKYAYKQHDLYTNTEYANLVNSENALGGMKATNNELLAAWIEQNNGSTDWQELGLRDATNITNLQLSVSGGKKEIRYYVSGSYTKDEGIMLQNEVQKVNFRSKVDAQLSKFVTMGINISGTYSQGSRPMTNYINFYRTPSALPLYHNAFTTALTGGYTGYARGNHFTKINAPILPPSADDPYGNPGWAIGDLSTSAQNNPRSIMDNTARGNESFQSVGNIFLKVDITKNLIFQTSNGYNVKFAPSFTYKNRNAEQDNNPSVGTYNSSLYVDLLTENTLTYLKRINKHDINVMVGYTAQKTRNDRVALRGTGFPTDKIHTLNAATAFELLYNGDMATGTYNDPDKTLESYLGRATYSYADKYLVSATMRLDRSSLFTAGNRNAWFPSVSLGWRMSEEEFMKPVRWINSLKLRGSYGVTGNNDISFNAANNTYSGANYPLGSGTGVITPGIANTSNTLANAEITWEQTDEFNVGLDLNTLDNRLNLAVDAYYSTTRALLFKQPAPSFTGFQNYWNNIGKVRNKGLEITIDSYNIRRKNFEWNTSANFSMNRNRVLEVGGEHQIINYGEVNEQYLTRVGSSVTQYYGYKVIGIWNSIEEINANPNFGGGMDKPGGVRIWDADKSGSIDANDMVPLGDPYPFCTWGLTNTFRYKNFDLSFLIQGVQGVTVYNRDGNYNESQRWNKKYVDNRWISADHPGDGKTQTIQSGSKVTLAFTDYFLDNASYVALRNATIGYSFGKKVLSKLHISGLRLYASGNNLFYLWSKNYRGVNPEARKTDGSYSNPLVTGYQVGAFPITSTVTFGIDITF